MSHLGRNKEILRRIEVSRTLSVNTFLSHLVTLGSSMARTVCKGYEIELASCGCMSRRKEELLLAQPMLPKVTYQTLQMRHRQPKLCWRQLLRNLTIQGQKVHRRNASMENNCERQAASTKALSLTSGRSRELCLQLSLVTSFGLLSLPYFCA